jgi:hypothetical protein
MKEKVMKNAVEKKAPNTDLNAEERAIMERLKARSKKMLAGFPGLFIAL